MSTKENVGIVGFVQTTFFVPLFTEGTGLTAKQKEKQVLKYLKEQVQHKGGQLEKSKKVRT